MTIYYSKTNQAFYDSNIHSRLPEDAVEISHEQHTALLVGQSNGQVIMPGKDGKPVLAPLPQYRQPALRLVWRRRRGIQNPPEGRQVVLLRVVRRRIRAA